MAEKYGVTGKEVVQVTKMSGTGNDFLLVDNRSLKYNTNDLKSITSCACPRRLSAGADGVIFVEPSTEPGHDFKMRIINADGSEAEMCGNGARCVAVYAYTIGAAGTKQIIQTIAGTLHATVAEDKVAATVQLSKPTAMEIRKGIQILDNIFDIYYLDTGVPHAIVFVDDVSKIDVVDLGKCIRHHNEFKPRGTNANFVQVMPNNCIKVRTYERGVEGETFACGTGSTAAAIVSGLVHNYKSPVEVTTSGGAILKIHFDKNGGKVLSAPYLEGEVDVVYKGELYWRK